MSILIERDIGCEMRDGCVLRANLFRPNDDGAYPTLLFRTPYDKNGPGNHSMALDPVRMATNGYVVVLQDVRGRAASQGEHMPFINEYADGADTIAWAAKQPWCNGRIGAYGISYHGFTTWAMAGAGDLALQAIAPTQGPCDHFDMFWRGGAFELGMHLFWTMRQMGPAELVRRRPDIAPAERRAKLERLVESIDDFDGMARSLPLRRFAAAWPDNPVFPYALENFEHPTRDEFHISRSVTGRHRHMVAPALITAGWYDVILRSDLENYKLLRAQGATQAAREETRLIIGPWTHGPGMHSSTGGDIDFGLRSSGLALDLREDLTDQHRRWFDHWLKDVPELDFAPVRIFVMGANRWRDEDEWPIARARNTDWHLHADGRFAPQSPQAEAPPLSYFNDPESPCPSVGGATLMPPQYIRGAVCQDRLMARLDVLSFTSEVVEEPIEVTGHLSATIWASTTGRDADWVVRLCDVHPDGRSYLVCDGILRASRRDPAWTDPHPVEPHEIVQYEIEMLPTSMTFLPGHRLQVLVTSSDFPRFDRNPGTGESSFTATELIPAVHRIYCDAEHPSHVTLPIIVD